MVYLNMCFQRATSGDLLTHLLHEVKFIGMYAFMLSFFWFTIFLIVMYFLINMHVTHKRYMLLYNVKCGKPRNEDNIKI